MAIFNSFLYVYQRVISIPGPYSAIPCQGQWLISMISAAPGARAFSVSASLQDPGASSTSRTWAHCTTKAVAKQTRDERMARICPHERWDEMGFLPRINLEPSKHVLRKNEHLEANGITSSLRRRKGTLRSVEMCQENAQVVA